MEDAVRDETAEMLDTRRSMPSNPLPMTRHAIRRAAQRGIPDWMIDLGLRRGRAIYVNRAIVFYLGWRELEPLSLPAREKDRAEGVTVRVGHDGSVVTVYRNRAGLQRQAQYRRQTWPRRRGQQ
jgi:PAS domain-containing protein